jgi:hypothetical protein
MKDWEPTFDPMAALQQLNDNQVMLNENQISQAQAMARMAERLNSQQSQIDTLIRGLDAANRANEIMLEQMLAQISNTQGDKDGQTISNIKTN